MIEGKSAKQERRRCKMKRIFILLLVLAMVSSSRASYKIMVDGSVPATFYVSHDTHVSLGIYTDTAVSSETCYFALAVNTSHGTIDYTTGFVVPPYGMDCSFLEHGMSAAEAGFPLPAGEDGITGLICYFGIPIPASSAIFDGIDYHSHEEMVTVSLYVTYDFTTSYVVDTVGISVPGTPGFMIPNGSESYIAGTQQTIEWYSNGGDDVKLEWSSNDGNSWTTETNSVPNFGSYLWTVPQVTSNKCRLRISLVEDPSVFAISSVFTIFECRLNSKADLDGNCKVDMTDFALLANDWLRNGNPFDEDYTEP
jgi:hypothetical protein